jgi:hypothetical protein
MLRGGCGAGAQPLCNPLRLITLARCGTGAQRARNGCTKTLDGFRNRSPRFQPSENAGEMMTNNMMKQITMMVASGLIVALVMHHLTRPNEG